MHSKANLDGCLFFTSFLLRPNLCNVKSRQSCKVINIFKVCNIQRGQTSFVFSLGALHWKVRLKNHHMGVHFWACAKCTSHYCVKPTCHHSYETRYWGIETRYSGQRTWLPDRLEYLLLSCKRWRNEEAITFKAMDCVHSALLLQIAMAPAWVWHSVDCVVSLMSCL